MNRSSYCVTPDESRALSSRVDEVRFKVTQRSRTGIADPVQVLGSEILVRLRRCKDDVGMLGCEDHRISLSRSSPIAFLLLEKHFFIPQ